MGHRNHRKRGPSLCCSVFSFEFSIVLTPGEGTHAKLDGVEPIPTLLSIYPCPEQQH